MVKYDLLNSDCCGKKEKGHCLASLGYLGLGSKLRCEQHSPIVAQALG